MKKMSIRVEKASIFAPSTHQSKISSKRQIPNEEKSAINMYHTANENNFTDLPLVVIINLVSSRMQNEQEKSTVFLCIDK